jgi:hypothetical protein
VSYEIRKEPVMNINQNNMCICICRKVILTSWHAHVPSAVKCGHGVPRLSAVELWARKQSTYVAVVQDHLQTYNIEGNLT